MTHEVGSRVLAIRNGEDGVLYVYGEGVYAGDFVRPGAVWPCDRETYAMIKSVVTQYDHEPIEEHHYLKFYDDMVAAHPDTPPQKTRAETINGLLTERGRPIDDRVRELWEATNENPCIHLDSGDIVWGFACWWGPIEGANKKYPEDTIKRVVVPVPEEFGRWKE